MRIGSRRASPRQVLVVGGAFAVLGPVLLAVGVYLYARTSAFLERATRTRGEVVELVERRSDDGYTYAPVFVFEDAKGTSRRIVSNTSSNPPGYAVGDEVDVLYDPDDPEDACIDSFFSLWGGATIVGGLGLVFGIVGVAVLIMRKYGKVFES